MHNLIGDIRYAARMLLRNPGVTAAALLALALGTGANSAIFSVVYAVLLRPLPVRDIDRLVSVAMVSEKLRVTGAQPELTFFDAIRHGGRFFDSLGAAAPGSATFSEAGDTTVKFWRVSAGFLPTLGVEPVLGRNFRPEEDDGSDAGVAMVAHAFWRGRLNRNPNVLGSRIVADGKPYTVVGVLPPGFHVDGRPADIYAPLGPPRPGQSSPVNVYARLARDTGIQQAQAEIDAWRKTRPASPLGWQPRLWALRDFQVRHMRLSLWVLLGAVGLVLLIACANTATLLLAHASGRQREIATRAALGAGKNRLLRQLLTESCLLALAGGLGGVVIALAAVRLVPFLAHERLPGLLEQTSVGGAVLAFTLAASLVTGLCFGIVPALSAVRGDLFTALKAGGRAGGPRRRLAWNLLIVTETALALTLAIGATLLVRTFFYLRDVAPGFRAEGVLTVRITPPRSKFTSRQQCNAYWQSVVESLRAIHGVQTASFAQALPLTGDNWVGTWVPEGVHFANPREIPPAWQYYVEAGYFAAMGIPLRRGRLFAGRDNEAAPKVAIVSESYVRRFWPGQDPIGKHIGGGKDPLIEVVGVVADVSAQESTKSAPPELYFHFLQMPTARIAAVVRGDPRIYRNPLDLEPAVRRAIASADPGRPPLQFADLRQVISGRIATERLSAQLIAIFAGLALVLAAVGIYGVLSFSVAQRTHEIGLRIALGAEPARVLGQVIAEAALPALCGIALGAAGALTVTRVMKSLLFGVGTGDPLSYTASSAALLAIAVAAAVIPALRATRIDPILSLRQE